MSLTQTLIDLIAQNQNTLGLAILLVSAAIEYLFPPFPGDAITLFGAFLVARHGFNGPAVFGAVLLGSTLGFMTDYAVGRWLGATEARWTGRLARLRPRLDALVARFSRHGTFYLVLNRFIPSVRGLFFLAAGMARLPAWKVLGCGLVSALAWNSLLLLVGLSVGRSWESLAEIAEAYAVALWSLGALLALTLFVRWWRRRRLHAKLNDQ